MIINFKVLGKPRGKARPRFSSRSGAVYTPRETREYEKRIAMAYKLSGGKMLDGKVQVGILAAFKIPKSWPRRKKEEAEAGKVIPGKPDIDNILKVVLDGLNGYSYEDDKNVTDVNCVKYYSRDGGEGIFVRVIGEEAK